MIQEELKVRAISKHDKKEITGYYYYCDWYEKGHKHKVRVKKDNHFIDISVYKNSIKRGIE